MAALVRAGLFVALLASTVGQRLAFKGVGYCLGPYPTFVLLSVSGAFIAIFGAACATIVATTGGFQPETRTWSCLSAFAAIGVCNALQGAGMIFANPRVPGFTQVLLQQAIIPFTLAIARVACAAAFSRRQYAGVACIMAGIGLQLLPAAVSHGLGHGDPGEDGPAAAVWAALFLLAQLPVAAAAVLQERVFSGVPVNVFHMMFWASLFQFLALLVIIPLGASSLSELAAELAQAWRLCWSEPGAGLVLLACVLLMLLSQLSQALMVKHASAAFMVLCLALAVPCSAAAFSAPVLMGDRTERLGSTTWAALAMVFGGIVWFRLGDDALQLEGPQKREALAPMLPRPKATPKVCVAGVGMIQSEYSNARQTSTPLWQEKTLMDAAPPLEA